MKKYIALLLLLPLVNKEVKAQKDIIENNMILLNNLESRYKTPCINYNRKKVKRKVEKIDKRVVKDLNNIYSIQLGLNEMKEFLDKMGYRESSKVNLQGRFVDTVYYRRTTEGRLDGYIILTYDTKINELISKKIMLATKTHFICETKEWQSYSYIDFDYLRRFIKNIEIPLQIAWSNVELESKSK